MMMNRAATRGQLCFLIPLIFFNPSFTDPLIFLSLLLLLLPSAISYPFSSTLETCSVLLYSTKFSYDEAFIETFSIRELNERALWGGRFKYHLRLPGNWQISDRRKQNAVMDLIVVSGNFCRFSSGYFFGIQGPVRYWMWFQQQLVLVLNCQKDESCITCTV